MGVSLEVRGRKAALAAAVAGLLVLTGCGGRGMAQPSGTGQETGDGGDGKLKVAATLFPYYDFTRQIAGSLADVELVVPAGMDSHSFEPTPADVKKILEADVVICNGGAMEYWVSQVLDAVDASTASGQRVVFMMDHVDAVREELVEGMEGERDGHGPGGEGVPAVRGGDDGVGAPAVRSGDYGGGSAPAGRSGDGEGDSAVRSGDGEGDSAVRSGDDGGGSPEIRSGDYGDAPAGRDPDASYDEHIWTSPVNAMKLAGVIADVLIEADPAHEREYEEGLRRYQGELLEIHEGFLQVMADRKRDMVVVGDRFPFQYLAREYGFEYRAAFLGCSEDSQPSAKTIAYLIDRVREEGIPVVYYLELGSRRVSELIGEETGAKPLLLHPCHSVTRREFEEGATYVELMGQNVENLRKGLDE